MQQEQQNKKISVDTKIERVKELCNELAEIVSEHYKSKDSHPIEAIQHNHVMREVAGAQFTIISALNLNFQELVSKEEIEVKQQDQLKEYTKTMLQFAEWIVTNQWYMQDSLWYNQQTEGACASSTEELFNYYNETYNK
jgi:hypothetical protein